MLIKDLLQLVFLELEHGHDMINFSEINRKSHQIFHQEIKVKKSGCEDISMLNKHGQLHGISRVWDENGQLWWEQNYMHGQLHGIYRRWHQNGQLGYEDNYSQGHKHGISRMWYPNGQLDYADNYHQGQLHGISRWWSDDGKSEYEANYHYGTQIEK